MTVINNSVVDAYFNLASEEYLLEHSHDDIFMLWRNDRSVIVGKNQNTYSEVDTEYIRKSGIKVVRRLTGGGAVFHDPGNVNFTFITDADEGGLDFGRFTAPVIAALRKMGVPAEADGRNDITANGCKISGNAQCVYNTADGRRRLMHHGTLLFSADMTGLARALRVSKDKLESKGIKSVRSRVCNISEIDGYCGPDSAEGFAAKLCELIAGEFGAPREFTDEEKCGIQKLCDEKYSLWSWNFGASPSHGFVCRKRFPYGTVEITLGADGGIINNIEINGDFFGERDTKELCEKLRGKALEYDALIPALDDIGSYIKGCTPEDAAGLIINAGDAE